METDKSGLKRKIGLFGGTLDPIHFGHLRAAEEVYETLGLDEIWFVPAFLPPHKLGKPLTSFEHRFKMVELATEGVNHFKAKSLERERQGVSYSVDLLKQVNSLYKESCTFFFIIGADAAMELDTWKNWQELPDLSSLVIINRPPFSMDEVARKIQEIFPHFKIEKRRQAVTNTNSSTIFVVEISGLEISSTDIRGRVRHGKSIRFLLPENVRKYIMENSLYISRKLEKTKESERKTVPEGMELASVIYKQILDNKGERIVVLDMRGTSPVADFFIIAHGRSTRHVQGMASRMKRELSRKKIRCRSVEGEEEGKWVLMDFEDVVVHLFYEPVRAFYDIEGLWSEAPRLIMTEAGLAREEQDNE